jgi:hypothetical protein
MVFDQKGWSLKEYRKKFVFNQGEVEPNIISGMIKNREKDKKYFQFQGPVL